MTVNALAVTLTGSRTYNGTTAAAAGNLTVANEVSGDNLTLSGSASLASANAGPEPITSFAGLTLGGTSAGNYTLTGASGSVTVTALAVTLTGSETSNGSTTAPASILMVANEISGDNLTLSGSVTLASANTGPETITSFTGLTLGGTSAGNYTLTGASGSVTVNPPVSLTLTENGPNSSNAGQFVNFTVTATGSVPNGDLVNLEDASSGNATVAIGAFTNGTVTIPVSSLSAGTHSLFAVYSGTPSNTVSQTVNAGAATHLVFASQPIAATAGVASSTVTVTLEDQYGNVATASGTQTIILTTTSSGGSFTSTPLTITTGNSTASFTYTDTKAGTPTITATDSALTTPTVTQQETVNAAAAHQMVLTPGAQTLTAGTPSATITATLEDQYGNVATAGSTAQSISLTTTSSGGSFSSTPLSISTGNSTASFTYTDTKTGTPTITATDTALTMQTVTQQETVNAAAASHLVLTPGAQTLTAGTPSSSITVTLKDQFGNLATANGTQTVLLSTTSAGGSFNPTTFVTLTSGTSTASFTYNDTKAGTPTITATDAALTTPTVTQQETVDAAAAYQLVLSPGAQTLTAGTPSASITVTLEDQFGNLATAASTQTVSLTTTSLAGSFTSTPLSISAGNSTASFTYTDTKAGTPTITATETALTTTTVTQQETVNAAAAYQMVLSPAAQTLTAGTPSSSITVTLEDQYGNMATAGSTTQSISLTSTSSGGIFTSTPLSITSGNSSASFTYTDTKAGSPTITATDSALTMQTVTQQETVNAAAASHLVLTPGAQTLTAGTPSSSITVTLKDQYGNVATANGTQTVLLSTTSAGGSFTPTAFVTIASGTSTASFTYNDTKSGTPTITANDAALTTPTVTQQETVNAAAAYQLVLSPGRSDVDGRDAVRDDHGHAGGSVQQRGDSRQHADGQPDDNLVGRQFHQYAA